MSLSGSRIASTAITMAHLRMVRPGSKAVTARTISTAAVPGTSLQTVFVPRSATQAPPDSGSTISVSGLAGCLLHLEATGAADWFGAYRAAVKRAPETRHWQVANRPPAASDIPRQP